MACCVPASAKAAVLRTAIKAVVQASFNMSILPLKVCVCLACHCEKQQLNQPTEEGVPAFKRAKHSRSQVLRGTICSIDVRPLDVRGRQYSLTCGMWRNFRVGRHLMSAIGTQQRNLSKALRVWPQGFNAPCLLTGGHHGETTEETGRAFSRYVKRHIFCRKEDSCDIAEDGESRAVGRSETGLRKAPRRDARPCRAAGKGFRRVRQKAAGQDLRCHRRHH